MRFKIDENLPIETATALHQAGHDALTVVGRDLVGCTDPDLAKVCQHERRALVTLDTGFGDIRAYPPDQYFGLIVLRLRRQDKQHVLRKMRLLVSKLGIEPLEQHLWIVDEESIRIRGLDAP
jgi:predicted nuclease of predicted toxin-antitoxin system